jgi:class 3 adenylate cyclase
MTDTSPRFSGPLRPLHPCWVTILCSDWVGFSALTHRLRSQRIAHLLNEYLAVMSEVITDQGGTVNPFLGDGILAMFGAPQTTTPALQVQQAIAAARQMTVVMAQLNSHWQRQGIPSVQCRWGIHQGMAMVGEFGGRARSDYTAVGATINFAVQLQTAAAPGTILVSAAIADYLQPADIGWGFFLPLKGVDKTVLVFDLLLDPRQ